MSTTQPETGADLFAEFFGLETAGFDDVAAVLPVFDPEPARMVAGCCSCGADITRPLDGPRPACTHNGETRPGGAVVVGGYAVKPEGRGRCFNDRHDVDGVALYRAGNYVPQCGYCVADRLGVSSLDLPEVDPAGFFPPPRVSRFDGGAFFSARGYVYELKRAAGGGWDAVAVSGGLAGPVHGKRQADAIAAVWSATGADCDVSAPVVMRREGRGLHGLPEARADVVCEGRGLYLIANPHPGSDPWADPCHRCNGQGHLKGYDHVHGGICFKCGGDRIAMSYTLEEAAASVRREARDARRDAERRALDAERKRRRWARFAVWNGRESLWLEHAAADGNDFAGKLRDRVLAGHELTAAQLKACGDALTRDQRAAYEEAYAEAARRAAVRASRAAGRDGETVTVSGTVARCWTYHTGPDWRPVTKRGLVVDGGDGVAVVMFTTAKAAFELSKGDAVTVTGVVKKAENRDRDTGAVQSLVKSSKFTKP